MTKKLLFVTTILLVVALAAFAADVTGKWTYQRPGRNGGDPTPVTITLKADGATLTGSTPGMGGRGGAAPADTPITNGKVTGDKIYFEVARPGRNGGDPTITKYEGTVSGDTLNLKITQPGRGGGDPTTTEFVAKREKS
jgi:hypothetical protein